MFQETFGNFDWREILCLWMSLKMCKFTSTCGFQPEIK